MSLRDLPLPENTPRPEMWTPESIVQAVRDGFTFLLPFVFEGLMQPNAYYIAGRQYSAFGVTVGPEHTDIIRMTPEGFIEMSLWFAPGMVPDEAFIGPINENGVGQVWALVDPEDIDWDLLNRGHQIRTKGLRRNPFVDPKKAGPQIIRFMETHMGFKDLELIYQNDYLSQGREHCETSPFTIISDWGGLVDASLTDDLINFLSKLGYWAEPWDDTELCIMVSDRRKEKKYESFAKTFKEKGRQPDPACQQSIERALKILASVPVVGWDEGGMHQFTWIRMKNFVTHKGRTTRELIIDSEPHNLSDLEKALEQIRKLPCVANIWYNLD